MVPTRSSTSFRSFGEGLVVSAARRPKGNETPQVVFIMGAARSGSTLL